MSTAIYELIITIVSNIGGDTVNLMELYDPDKNEWKRLASPNVARDRHNIVQLPFKMIDYKFDW